MAYSFMEIKHESNIADSILEYAKNDEAWFPYYNFAGKPLPYDLLEQDPFFKWLGNRYEYLGGVIKLDPYTCYDWHVDTRRGVGINMLLTPNGSVYSHSLFSRNKKEVSRNFMQLHYKPNTYYLYNTQHEHMVINFQKPRYMFSVEFLQDKDKLTFDRLLKDVEENYEKNSKK